MTAEVVELKAGRGDFFAVDAGVWDVLCRQAHMHMAIAYLVMARGTGPDNATTAWSVNAIEERTSLSRHQAKAAVAALVGYPFIAVERAGSRTVRPRYKLLTADKVKGTTKGSEPAWIWLPNALIDGADGEVPPIELVLQSASFPALTLLV